FAGRAHELVVAVTILGHGFMLNRLVARETTLVNGADVAELEQTWAWIRESRDASWGRVYLQDTFGLKTGYELDHSHMVTRTSERTGAEQIGAYYGNTPYERPEYWLALAPQDPQTVDLVIPVMEQTNATHLLLVNPALFDMFRRDGRFHFEAQF